MVSKNFICSSIDVNCSNFLRQHKIVWHGAKMDSIDSNCDGWHVSSPDKVGLGSSLLGNKLLDQGEFSLEFAGDLIMTLVNPFAEMYSCQQKNIVLCIEVLSHDNRRKRDLPDHPNQNYEEFSEDGER